MPIDAAFYLAVALLHARQARHHRSGSATYWCLALLHLAQACTKGWPP